MALGLSISATVYQVYPNVTSADLHASPLWHVVITRECLFLMNRWWRCDCDATDTAGGRALYLLRVTNTGLWLVKTYHVTWILASDWLMMASVPQAPRRCLLAGSNGILAPSSSPLKWSDADGFNAGSNYGSDTFIGKIESNNREHRGMRRMKTVWKSVDTSTGKSLSKFRGKIWVLKTPQVQNGTLSSVH